MKQFLAVPPQYTAASRGQFSSIAVMICFAEFLARKRPGLNFVPSKYPCSYYSKYSVISPSAMIVKGNAA
jgi:hypothetical protein